MSLRPVPPDTQRTKSHYDAGDDITAYWEANYRKWQANPAWGVFEQKAAWFDERFDHLLPAYPAGRVLDWGCGSGMYSTPLLKRFDQYVGWDASPTAIALAQTHFGEDDQRCFAMRDLGLKPPCDELGTFDLVISITVLQHQPAQTRLSMIEYIKQLMKPSGRYIGLEMIGDTAAYDMPPMAEATWRVAWQPLEIEFDIHTGRPGWTENNVWFTR
jgi:2-polyprenyl-3-methyl-5-hydroxy-6-metoxy-1,4-benzoquinol methylase